MWRPCNVPGNGVCNDRVTASLPAHVAAAALEQLCAQDTLVTCPTDGDSLLFAVAVCAPYSVLAGYKYKVKLTPGTQKKGKAAKQAAALFSAAAASQRERELILAMPLDDTVRDGCCRASRPRAVACLLHDRHVTSSRLLHARYRCA